MQRRLEELAQQWRMAGRQQVHSASVETEASRPELPVEVATLPEIQPPAAEATEPPSPGLASCPHRPSDLPLLAIHWLRDSPHCYS